MTTTVAKVSRWPVFSSITVLRGPSDVCQVGNGVTIDDRVADGSSYRGTSMRLLDNEDGDQGEVGCEELNRAWCVCLQLRDEARANRILSMGNLIIMTLSYRCCLSYHIRVES